MIHLRLDQFERLDHGQRVHADAHVLAVIFEHAERQHDRPMLLDRPADLVRQHEFVAHGYSMLVCRARMASGDTPSMSLSFSTMISNSRNSAPSKTEPMGSTDVCCGP